MNEHSKQFEHIKELYDMGEWPKAWVKNAVKKNRITAEEYREITGTEYDE